MYPSSFNDRQHRHVVMPAEMEHGSGKIGSIIFHASSDIAVSQIHSDSLSQESLISALETFC